MKSEDLFSLFKAAMLCICLRKPLLFTWNGKKKERKGVVVVVVLVGWGGFWSEIKQTAPLQRTSSHLCDVKSKLINKASHFQGVLSQTQGVQGASPRFHRPRKVPHESTPLAQPPPPHKLSSSGLTPLIMAYCGYFVSNWKRSFIAFFECLSSSGKALCG